MKQLTYPFLMILFANCASHDKAKTKASKTDGLAGMQLSDTCRYVGTASYRSTALKLTSGRNDTAFKDTVVVIRVNIDSAYCSWNYPYDSDQLFFSRVITLPLKIQRFDLYEFGTNDERENSFLQLLFSNDRVEITDTVELIQRKIWRAQHFEGKKI